MVKVEKCCFCVRLSNFAIINGCFGAFLSLILIILVGSFLLTYDNLVTILHKKGDFDSVQVSTFLEKYKNIVVTIVYIYVALQAFSFVSSVSLVCGVINKRPTFLILWLVSQSFLVLFWILASLLVNDVNLLLYALLSGYFWICIYSLYQSMQYDLFDSFYQIGNV